MYVRILDRDKRVLAVSPDLTGSLWRLVPRDTFVNTETIVAAIIASGDAWRMMFGSVQVRDATISDRRLEEGDSVVLVPGSIAVTLSAGSLSDDVSRIKER
jgi:hypothetical protein